MVRVKESADGSAMVFDQGGKLRGRVQSPTSYISKPVIVRNRRISFAENVSRGDVQSHDVIKEELLAAYLSRCSDIEGTPRKPRKQIKVLVERLPEDILQASLKELDDYNKQKQATTSTRRWCSIM